VRQKANGEKILQAGDVFQRVAGTGTRVVLQPAAARDAAVAADALLGRLREDARQLLGPAVDDVLEALRGVEGVAAADGLRLVLATVGGALGDLEEDVACAVPALLRTTLVVAAVADRPELRLLDRRGA
jgi:hypothetical protein